MKVTLPHLHELKLAGTPIVMITAYDHPSWHYFLRPVLDPRHPSPALGHASQAAANALAASPTPPVRPATSPNEGATGNRPYQSPPSPAPSGKEAIANCCASTPARAGPSVATPGVSCFTASAPAPSVSRDVVISEAAPRAPA